MNTNMPRICKTRSPIGRRSNGELLCRSDLPSPTQQRWGKLKKGIVVEAIVLGVILKEDAQQTYNLSDEELDEWFRKYQPK